MTMIRYVIADDHKIFRQGLRLALADGEDLELIGEAADGEGLLQLIGRQIPDVILLDLNMPGMGGKEALRIVRREHPEVKVLILTMHDEEQFVIDVIEAGANGYLLKNAEPDEIIMAMRIAYETDFYFNDLVSAELLRKILKKTFIAPAKSPRVNLSEKETEVLRLICAECTASEIAQVINLSQRTVEGIRSSLLEKTGARNTAGLVLFAVKNEIIEKE